MGSLDGSNKYRYSAKPNISGKTEPSSGESDGRTEGRTESGTEVEAKTDFLEELHGVVDLDSVLGRMAAGGLDRFNSSKEGGGQYRLEVTARADDLNAEDLNKGILTLRFQFSENLHVVSRGGQLGQDVGQDEPFVPQETAALFRSVSQALCDSGTSIPKRIEDDDHRAWALVKVSLSDLINNDGEYESLFQKARNIAISAGVEGDGGEEVEGPRTDTRKKANSEAQVEGSTIDYKNLVDSLDQDLREQLISLKEDFQENGIVRIEKAADKNFYRGALEKELTAEKSWEEDILPRLLENEAELLKRAAEMPGGGQLIGVYPNGELAIKQRSRELTSVIRTTNKGGRRGASDEHENEGDFILKPYSEAMGLDGKREEGGNIWTSPREIVCAVREAGYHTPGVPKGAEIKPGRTIASDAVPLVAAAEAVTDRPYIEDARGTNFADTGKRQRIVVLEFPDDVGENEMIHVVYGYHGDEVRCIGNFQADTLLHSLGVVLWLRG